LINWICIPSKWLDVPRRCDLLASALTAPSHDLEIETSPPLPLQLSKKQGRPLHKHMHYSLYMTHSTSSFILAKQSKLLDRAWIIQQSPPNSCSVHFNLMRPILSRSSQNLVRPNDFVRTSASCSWVLT
jgi:hypothetical protein